ncbi:MAG TPA: aminotransferase class V-fold PLP-dependent enzyme [Thermoleophilaceae bacterium]|jgi:selenocysteine lyase/cysteine desulfurase|nr:aminotransferase class V-fold PLP-dependent enzyme [Thermoleophilaceae bacterium]
MTAPVELERARSLFPAARGYLDSATIGLPPATAMDELLAALEEWRRGGASAPAYDGWVERSRAAFARLVGAPASRVAVGAQVSSFAGVVAGSLPAGAEVLCAEGDFTSVLFPFLVQRERGVRVRVVPLERLADELRPGTSLVAFSAVQSSDGRVADLDAIVGAAGECGAATFLDATQACGWLPLEAERFDYLACSAYKWLLSPRGTCFFAVRPERLERLTPQLAGWYAGEERWSSLYGEPLRLAGDARRLDLSPAWLSFVGTAPALELLAGIGADAIREWTVGLAERVRDALGMERTGSAIVSVRAPGAAERLSQAGIRASVRGDGARIGFHLYNDAHDAEAAVAALAG